jgi:hypothetical protein
MKSEKVGLITFEESEVDEIEGIGEEEAKNVLFLEIHADPSFYRTDTWKTRRMSRDNVISLLLMARQGTYEWSFNS